MTRLTVQTKAMLQRAIWTQQGKIRIVKRENKEGKDESVKEDSQIRGVR